MLVIKTVLCTSCKLMREKTLNISDLYLKLQFFGASIWFTDLISQKSLRETQIFNKMNKNHKSMENSFCVMSYYNEKNYRSKKNQMSQNDMSTIDKKRYKCLKIFKISCECQIHSNGQIWHFWIFLNWVRNFLVGETYFY